jgi:hypothetical protein
MFHHDPRHTGNLSEPLLYQTAVPETPPAARPFLLHQNRPNPFHPHTSIRYQIQEVSTGGLLPVRLEAHEGAVVDHDGRHPEPPEAAEQLEARSGVLAHVEEVDRRSARLKERERGLAVDAALHREQQNPFHGGSTIPFDA